MGSRIGLGVGLGVRRSGLMGELAWGVGCWVAGASGRTTTESSSDMIPWSIKKSAQSTLMDTGNEGFACGSPVERYRNAKVT